MNNKTLLIIFVSCLIIFLAGKLFRGNKASSFDPVIISVDTATVDRIQFVSAGEMAEEFELIRNSGVWQAVKGNAVAPVATTSINAILSNIVELNAKRIVTKDPARHEAYEVTDEKATKMIVWAGKKQIAELLIGAFRFDQVARTATSYIRNAKRPDVYVIDGFQSMGFKARFDQFRDKRLVRVNAEDLTSIDWTDGFGHKQVIQKIDGEWHYAGMEAVDSAKFSSCLSTLAGATGSEFSDLTSTNGLDLLEKLTLSGNNMMEPTIISAFSAQDTLKPFLIHSTANPDAIFKSDSTGLYKRIFSDLRAFWPNG